MVRNENEKKRHKKGFFSSLKSASGTKKKRPSKKRKVITPKERKKPCGKLSPKSGGGEKASTHPFETTFKAGKGGVKRCKPLMEVVALRFVREALVRTIFDCCERRIEKEREEGGGGIGN